MEGVDGELMSADGCGHYIYNRNRGAQFMKVNLPRSNPTKFSLGFRKSGKNLGARFFPPSRKTARFNQRLNLPPGTPRLSSGTHYMKPSCANAVNRLLGYFETVF